jgi:hypothetical protein
MNILPLFSGLKNELRKGISEISKQRNPDTKEKELLETDSFFEPEREFDIHSSGTYFYISQNMFPAVLRRNNRRLVSS